MRKTFASFALLFLSSRCNVYVRRQTGILTATAAVAAAASDATACTMYRHTALHMQQLLTPESRRTDCNANPQRNGEKRNKKLRIELALSVFLLLALPSSLFGVFLIGFLSPAFFCIMFVCALRAPMLNTQTHRHTTKHQSFLLHRPSSSHYIITTCNLQFAQQFHLLHTSPRLAAR